MDLLIYFGKVNIYWILFYACYWLLFRKHTFFVWNRFYLLGSLIVSFVLPLIHFPDDARVIPTAVYAASAIPVYVARPESTKVITHWTQFVWAIQIIGCGLMFFKLLEAFKDLFKLIRQGETISLEDHTLVLLPHNEIGSFSFLKWLVVNFADYELNFDPILRHESVHIRQLHSLDILLIEILKVGFWFNPVLWFYKKSLQEVHEYLADEKVPNRDQYARFLVAYALNAPIASLTNHFFNSSLLKSRIQMIYKNRNSQWVLGKYLMIFPIIGMVVMLTAARERLLTAIERNNFKILSTKEISVSGIVSDENGMAIESANVVAKGKMAGTMTDMYGKFEISDLTESDSLVISHINYESIIIGVKSTKLNFITLHKKDNKLQKVVITSNIVDGQSLAGSAPASQPRELITMEEMPQFPGGEGALSQFLYNNIVYPTEAASDHIQGEVGVSFTVNEKGYIRNPKIVKEMGSGLDEEALRVVLKMPRWEPGKQGGEAIPVQYNLNILFALESTKDNRQSQATEISKPARYESNYKLAESRSPQNMTIGLKSGKATDRTFRGTAGMNAAIIMPQSPRLEFSKLTGDPQTFSSKPIYFVDGKLNENPETIKSDDIESIAVLRGESATSAYGYQGKDGVVIIKTKKK